MDWLETYLLNQTAVFTLVLGRIGGLVATSPLLSMTSTPLRVRALLTVALAMLITPLHVAAPIANQLDVPQFARMLVGEVLIGLLLGLGVMIMLSGVQVAGQIVSQMSGLALGDVYNPALDSSVSIFTQLFYFVTLAVYVAIGGHRMTVNALLDTFEWAPPGQAHLGDSFAEACITLLSQSFELGVRAAGPLLIALFLATIVLGLVSRTLPQINTVAVGFSINSLLTLSLLMLTIGSVAWTFQEPLSDTLLTLQRAVADAQPTGSNPALLPPS